MAGGWRVLPPIEEFRFNPSPAAPACRALSITRTMNPQLLMIPTAARIVEETEETAPPPARQIQWAPMAFSEQESVCPAARPHSTRTARLQSSRCSVSSRVRRPAPLSTYTHARTPHTRARARACTHARTHKHAHARAASVAAASIRLARYRYPYPYPYRYRYRYRYHYHNHYR